MENINWFYLVLGMAAILVVAVVVIGIYSSVVKAGNIFDLEAQPLEQEIGYNAIFVSDQITGTSVVLSLLANQKPGFVVIQEAQGDSLGKVIGVSDFLNSGERSRLMIELVRSIQKGEKFYAIIYEDDGDKAFDAYKDKKALGSQGEEIKMLFWVIEGESRPTSITI